MAKPKKTSLNWPAQKTEMRAVDGLTPYANNSRTHSDDQIAQIAASIREWGFTNPVLINGEGTIIAGHGRVLAAKKLGYSELPCMIADGWSDAQMRAYVIADNKLAENAGWDVDLLASELADLNGAIDLDLIGFGDDELAELLAPGIAGKTDPDQAPEVQAVALSERGDTWTLGRHRLRCGDSTNAEDVAELLGDVKPTLMVTDPPYGVNYDPAWRKMVHGKASSGLATGKVSNDDRADWTEAWRLFPGDVAYVWHGALHNVEVAQSLESADFDVRSQIIWVKSNFAISRGHYHWQHEPALYAERKVNAEKVDGWMVDQESLIYSVRAGKTANWKGGRKQTTVWNIEHIKNDTGHGTQKPVECMKRPIVNNTSPGQAVYEPFCGSGTTIIAGEMEGRPVFAMELDPIYIDVIVRRWQAFTGQKAVDQNGKTFDDRETAAAV